MAAELSCAEELARLPPPTLAALRSTFTNNEIRSAVDTVSQGTKRIALAVAYGELIRSGLTSSHWLSLCSMCVRALQDFGICPRKAQ